MAIPFRKLYKSGYAVFACFSCGSFYEEEKSPLGHKFDAAGKCHCGAVDPDYEGGEGEYCLGDVNGDGAINGKDSNLLKQILSGAVAVTEEMIAVCDMHKDGSINGMDANLLARYIAGEIAGF